MKNNLLGLTSEAIQVNNRFIGKSVGLGVETAQTFFQDASAQTREWINVKNVEDIVSQQELWNKKAVKQSQIFGRKVLEISNETYSAYLSLWKDYTDTIQVPLVPQPTAASSGARPEAKEA